MLAIEDIDRIVKEAASAAYRPAVISRVSSRPVADSYGDDALSVLIVFAKGQSDSIDFDAALDALVDIQRSLREHGEERFAIVHYATDEDLEAEELEALNGGVEP